MWYVVAVFAGSLVGILICALCTASRVAEVESLVETFRLRNRNLENRLRRGQGRRAHQILGTRHEDAAQIREKQEALAARCKGGRASGR